MNAPFSCVSCEAALLKDTVESVAQLGIWEVNLIDSSLRYLGGLNHVLGLPLHTLRHLTEWEAFIHPDDLETSRQQREKSASSEEGVLTSEYRIRDETGQWHWIASRGRVTERDGEGRAIQMAGVHILIDELKKTSQALESSQARLELALEASHAGYFEHSADFIHHVISPRWAEIYGYTLDQLANFDLHQFWINTIHPEDKDRVEADYQRYVLEHPASPLTQKYRILDSKGEWRWIHMRAKVVRNDSRPLPDVVGVILDITREHERSQQLESVANYDQLTGLPNRYYFNNELARRIEEGRRTKEAFSLLFIDLDGFKPVNDDYGHDVGDLLLVQVGERLQTTASRHTFVARIGGDEFTVMCPRTEAEHMAEQMELQIKTFFLVNEKMISIGASIGMAHWPEDGKTAQALLKYSDQAMYTVKEKRGKRDRR